MQNEDLFLTLQGSHVWEQEIKKSKFILNIARVHSEQEAIDFINQVSKEHAKATHNVWCYVLGDDSRIQRYSDDGEPNGTAGVPMLEVLKNNNLHNVVAVVTRYFGGIKLGAGGLIRAYAGTVANGLTNISLYKRQSLRQMKLRISYPQFDKVNYWLTSLNDYVINNVEYGVDIVLEVLVDINENDFEKNIVDFLAGDVSVTKGDVVYTEIEFTKDISKKTSSLY